MRLELEITEAERAAIRRQCEDAIQLTEAFYKNAVPYKNLKDDVVGTRGLKVMALLMGVGTGAISLIVWRWVFGAFGLTDFLLTLGLPRAVCGSLPELLALISAASGSWYGTYAWGVEGRLHMTTRAFNAHERSGVLHSVVEELSRALPGAVPDMSEYAHSHEDDRPNQLVETALGRMRQR